MKTHRMFFLIFLRVLLIGGSESKAQYELPQRIPEKAPNAIPPPAFIPQYAQKMMQNFQESKTYSPKIYSGLRAFD